MKITQHIPAFIDTDEPARVAEVNNTEELLKVDWVKSYTEWPQFKEYIFSKDKNYLIIENKDCSYWWVVGYVDGELELPVARFVKKGLII